MNLQDVILRINGKAVTPMRAQGTMLTKRQRLQQLQRRIYERRGVFVSVDELEAAGRSDPLEARAMWRRQGRPLLVPAGPRTQARKPIIPLEW